MTTYLDWNATTPRHPTVVQAMREAEAHAWANPSSVHQAGRAARRAVEDARELLARLVHVSPRDVVFTGGGTEANHLALSGARWLVTSRIEHPSVVAQAEEAMAQGARVEFVQPSSSGVVHAEVIEQALSRIMEGVLHEPRNPDDGGLSNLNTPLVAVAAVNHETGVIQPLREISEVVRSRGARLHVDAVQLMGRGSLEPLQYADSLAIAAHKFRGPKGLGALAFACGWTPRPIGRGGAQERGLRPGTVDASALAGLSAALVRLPESEEAYQRAALLGDALEHALRTRATREVVLHGVPSARLRHVVNFRAAGWKGDELVAALDLEGVCVSSGSACSAGTAEPSAVIQAMLGREAAVGAVRVSLGEDSNQDDLNRLLSALVRLGILRPE